MYALHGEMVTAVISLLTGALAHARTHARTNQLTHSPAHSRTHSPAHPPTLKAPTARKFALLKCNAMSAPFERAFDDQLAGRAQSNFMVLHYRDEEAIYIKASHDRVTVMFSTLFKEETDQIIAKVFLQVCSWWSSFVDRFHLTRLSSPFLTVSPSSFPHFLTFPQPLTRHRNSWTVVVSQRFRTPHRLSTPTEILHWSCAVFLA